MEAMGAPSESTPGQMPGSSGELLGPIPPPPPPQVRCPPQSAAGPGVGSVRGAAEATLDLTNGKIVFYTLQSRFQCTCSVHPGCTLTRKGTGHRFRRAQGRPLGLIARWLEIATHDGVVTKEDHQNKFLLATFSKADRLQARRRLRQREGPSLEQYERNRYPDEGDSEPEDVP